MGSCSKAPIFMACSGVGRQAHDARSTCTMNSGPLYRLAQRGLETLEAEDRELASLLEREHLRQESVLTMVAAASLPDPSVLICQAASIVNVTTEGSPGARYHGGASVVDEIERLAIARAKTAFGARYANVQPH